MITVHRWACRAALVLVAVAAFGQIEAAAPTKPTEDTALRERFADYRSWKRINPKPIEVPPDNNSLCLPSRLARERAGPHSGGWINVYVSDTGRKAYLSEKSARLPVGTVIVKEKLSSDKHPEPVELGVMIKQPPGYDTKAGDWQFVFVDKQDQLIDAPAELTNCRTCHQHRAAADYVFRRALPSGKQTNAREARETRSAR